MDGLDVVKLRDYIESLIHHERELREAKHERDVEALRLQAQEYTRRLESLNMSHERMDKAQTLFVMRPICDDRMGRSDEWQRKTELALAGLVPAMEFEGWRRSVDNRLAEDRGAHNRTIALVTVALTLLGLVLRFLPP